MQELVLNHACSLLVALSKAELIDDDFTVSINISACQFKKFDFESSLLSVLRKYDVPPTRIVLEITESMLLDDLDLAVEQMERMRSFGFKFSIDDFGTGYSSLSYLQTLPVDEIKIDRSFVENILGEGVGLSIVRAIVVLADSLGFSVIAEGIEKLEQLERLQEIDVEGLQGFFIARPMDTESLLEWLASSSIHLQAASKAVR
jgi:EAL domain-containing protein (putative c-di-GMP-specific phosphodiesterase class I)